MNSEGDNIIVRPISPKPISNNSIDGLRHLVFKNLIFIIIIGILGGLLGIIIATYKPINYQSNLTFALDEGTGSRSTGVLNLASQLGFNLGSSNDVFEGDNILEIIKCRRIVERVLLSVDTFGNKPYSLIEYYLQKCKTSNPKVKSVHFPVAQPQSSFTYLQDSILYITYQEFAASCIDAAKPDRKLGIYQINLTTPDEKFTKDFTDRLVSETNNFYVEIKSKKAKETLQILENRVSAMKSNLTSSLSDRASTQDINVNPAFSEAQVPIQKQQANIQVYSAAYGEMFKNLETARFQYLNEVPLMQIIDPADYPMKKIKAGKLKMGIVFAIGCELLLAMLLWIRQMIKARRTI